MLSTLEAILHHGTHRHLLSSEMSKLRDERVCLLCVRHQEQACGPSEGRGRPGLDATSSPLSFSVT